VCVVVVVVVVVVIIIDVAVVVVVVVTEADCFIGDCTLMALCPEKDRLPIT